MEYLVTMTTRVPEGTAEQAVGEVRAREAAHSRELAAEGRLLRLWQLPVPGHALGLWRAADPAELQELFTSLPQAPYLTIDTTPLTTHPSDPATAAS